MSVVQMQSLEELMKFTEDKGLPESVGCPLEQMTAEMLSQLRKNRAWVLSLTYWGSDLANRMKPYLVDRAFVDKVSLRNFLKKHRKAKPKALRAYQMSPDRY